MKRFLAALWAVLLLLFLSACKGKEPLPPESSAPPASAPVETPPPEEPDPQPDPVPLPDLQPGKILALGDQRLGFAGGPGDDQLATQAELDRWNDLIATAPVVRMDFNDMHQEEKDLSVEQEQEILDALRGPPWNCIPRITGKTPSPAAATPSSPTTGRKMFCSRQYTSATGSRCSSAPRRPAISSMAKGPPWTISMLGAGEKGDRR